MVKKVLLTLTVCLCMCAYAGSQTLTLEACYEQAGGNYPAIKKLDLIEKSAAYDLKNANSKFLPQLNFSGQATYQSQTVNFSDALGALPDGLTLPSISKDQYRVQGEVSQLLYDGGHTKNQKQLVKATGRLEAQNVENTIYAINDRINGLYFSILLMDAQLKEIAINQESLKSQLAKTKTALQNGVAYKSNLEELQAEVVSMDMEATACRSDREAYLQMLSMFIGRALPASTQLALPDSSLAGKDITRPELKSFDFQKAIYQVQQKQLRSAYLPEVSAFFQGAYGRPTLNIIENEFGPWFLTGIRFSWQLGSLYTLSSDKNKLSVSAQLADADKATFLLNTRLELTRQQQEVKKYQAMISQDDKMIALRRSITRSAEAQLSNGVITTHEYIQQLQAQRAARQTRILHQIQLLKARYEQKYITGQIH